MVKPQTNRSYWKSEVCRLGEGEKRKDVTNGSNIIQTREGRLLFLMQCVKYDLCLNLQT